MALTKEKLQEAQANLFVQIQASYGIDSKEYRDMTFAVRMYIQAIEQFAQEVSK